MIDEIDKDIKVGPVKKVLFCAGKEYYYDLLEACWEQRIKNLAIVWLEKLHPLVKDIIVKIMQNYSKATDYVWC